MQVCADPNPFAIDNLDANQVGKVDTDCTKDYIGIESMYFESKHVNTVFSQIAPLWVYSLDFFLFFSSFDLILNLSASNGCSSGGPNTSKYCGGALNTLTGGVVNVPICGKW